MRVLIVHGFGKGRMPQRKAEEFGSIVQQSFLRFVSDEVSFDVRECHDLEDYIPEDGYDMETVAFPMAFELLDFVFIDGNAKMNPWHPSFKQLRTLIRISRHREKYIFACNLGALVLTLLVNIGEDELNIENGQGNGDIQVDLTKYRSVRSKNPPNYELLESSTGDLYRYSKIECDWVVPYNIGMRKSGIAVLHKTFRVTTLSQERNMKLGASEISCQKLRAQYGHWIFRDILENDFIAPIERSWNIHTPRSNSSIIPLADSAQGIEIFECDQAVGLSFGITVHNTPAVQLLLNFVAHKLTLMSKQDRLSALRRGQSCNSLANRIRSNIQTSSSSIGSQQVFQSPSKLNNGAEDNKILEKSAISRQQKPTCIRKDVIDVIPLDLNILQRSPVEIGRNSPAKVNHQTSGTNPVPIVRKIQGDAHSSAFYYQKLSTMEYMDMISCENLSPLPVKKYEYYKVKSTSFSNIAHQNDSEDRPKSAPFLHGEIESDFVKTATNQDNKMIPAASMQDRKKPISTKVYCSQKQPFTTNTISADVKVVKKPNETQIQAMRRTDKSYTVPTTPSNPERPTTPFDCTVYVDENDNKITVLTPSKPFSSYKKYDKLSQSTPDRFNHPIRHVGPYVSQSDKERLEEMENRRKWIGPDFIPPARSLKPPSPQREPRKSGIGSETHLETHSNTATNPRFVRPSTSPSPVS